jgi:hypothetical protein
MIRRRGKRGRIRRAEAVEAYENQAILTNDAPGLPKKRPGHDGHLPDFAHLVGTLGLRRSVLKSKAPTVLSDDPLLVYR